jgi:predicted nucleic acid-binding Zn ribbon protein
MPIYEFYCVNSGCPGFNSIIEETQRMNDEHKAQCQFCGGDMKRKFGNFIDQYKGEGFTRSADAKEEVDVWKSKGE